MIEYLSFQAGTEYPTLAAVLYTVLLAFLLSTSIAVTYSWTTPRAQRPPDFFQALVLAAIVASTVMQAIGDSLAVGLGMLGALAIIRFRTNLRNPRDIIFMFSSLAAGLACGVYGFTISLVGTVSFCMVALALKGQSLSKPTDYPARLRFRLPKDSEALTEVESLLRLSCKKFTLESMRERKEGEEGATEVLVQAEYAYQLTFRKEHSYKELIPLLQQVNGMTDLRLNPQPPQ